MFNLTYTTLAESNKQIESLYKDFETYSTKIQKALGRRYKSKEENSLDSMVLFNEAMNLVPIHASAIKKTHENKVDELKKKFIPKTDASLNDVKIGVEYLESLTLGDRYQALAEQPELRSLLQKHVDTFGSLRVQESVAMLDETFRTMYADELKSTQDAVEAIEDLQLSFEHRLREQFEPFGGHAMASSIYDNYLDDTSDDQEKDTA